MIEQKILNRYVIDEIQKYLASMNWAQREYKGEKLETFLKGVEYGLYSEGIVFKLKSEYSNVKCTTEFWIDVYQYSDPADCWSDKELKFLIFENHIKEPIMCQNN